MQPVLGTGIPWGSHSGEAFGIFCPTKARAEKNPVLFKSAGMAF